MVEVSEMNGLIPCTIFEICEMKGGGKSGTLVCTLNGIEFKNSKRHLIYYWNEISGAKVEISPGAGTATFGVIGIDASITPFYGRLINKDGYRTIERIAAVLVKERSTKKNRETAVPTLGADVVDGTGWAPPVGTKVTVTINDGKIILYDSQSTEFVLPLSSLNNIFVQGHTSKTNFGLWGGGFGFKGAAEGIAIATIVNKLTTKVKTWVLVSIDSQLGRATLLILNSTEMPVRHFFRPAQDKALELAGKTQSNSEDDLVSALERITGLYEKGLLSDDEFKKMKKKLLL